MPCASCQKRKEWLMKNWHWLIIAIIAYFIGVKFSSPGRAVLSKIGM